MTNEIAKMYRLQKEFDAYNTIAKKHTITIGDQTMTCDEMISGHIKVNGTEAFKNYDEMTSLLQEGASIETENV